MCRRLFVAVTTIIGILVIPAATLAAGAPVRKPPTTVGAGATAPSTPATASTGQEPLFGGCGKGRVRDPKTNRCRGPGDIGRNE
jgi:hypothetical protein